MNDLNTALFYLEKLAALVATPGVDEATQKLANEQMQKLLNGPIKVGLSKIVLDSHGIIT